MKNYNKMDKSLKRTTFNIKVISQGVTRHNNKKIEMVPTCK